MQAQAMPCPSGGYAPDVRPSLYPWPSTPLDRPIELGNGASSTQLDTYLASDVPLGKSWALLARQSSGQWPELQVSTLCLVGDLGPFQTVRNGACRVEELHAIRRRGGPTLHELESQIRTTNLKGLQRWGYVVVERDPADSRADPPRSDWLVRPTRGGRKAQEVWRPLTGETEERWRARFGNDEVEKLVTTLRSLVSQLEIDLLYLPVLKFADGMLTHVPLSKGRAGFRQRQWHC
jgi:DNA-binding MarR family transcriptional regulator